MRRFIPLVVIMAALVSCKPSGDHPSKAHRLLAEEATAFLERKPAPTGKVHELELVASPTTVPMLDGRALNVWAYNGQVPGPMIRVRVGDTLRVNFKNELPQPTTVHWHGIRLPNGMDGVPGVTQPAIPPGGSFVYEFTARDPGTFWYHPHVRGSEQLGRGLYGVLIVEEAQPAPEREILWVLDDFRLDDTGQIDQRFITRGDLAHDGRWGNAITVNGRLAPQFDLAPGERVRLRILNAANGRVFRPDFSAFDAEVIAFDGLSTARPLSTEGLVLAPGNRVDLDLVAPTEAGQPIQVVDRFTRRVNLLATMRVGPAVEVANARSLADSESVSSAETEGKAATERVAATQPIPNSPLGANDRATAAKGFVPTWKGAETLPVDLEFRLNASRGGPYGIQWMINEQVMIHDDDSPMSEWHEPPYNMKRGRWTKMRFTNESARLHPMHLHGQFFKVVARNGLPVDEEHWRDTVLVGPRETVDVGLVPTEPGNWMLHCHIMEHQDAGMMTLVGVN